MKRYWTPLQAVSLFPRTKKDYFASNRAAGLPQGWSRRVEKWRKPPFRHGKFGKPEVARICRELILLAKSIPYPVGKSAEYKWKSEGLRPLRHLPGDCLTVQGLPIGQVYFYGMLPSCQPLWRRPAQQVPSPCAVSALNAVFARTLSMAKAYQILKRASRNISGWLFAIHCPGPVEPMGPREFMFLFPSG